MSIQVNDFRWEPGKNDAEYIRLLESSRNEWQKIAQKAIAKLKTLSKAQEPKPVKRWNTKEASPYCPNIEECGRPLEEGWAHCPYCGQAVKWDR